MQVVGGLILGIRFDQGRLDEVTAGLSEDDLGMIAILVPVFHGDKQGAARLLEDLVEARGRHLAERAALALPDVDDRPWCGVRRGRRALPVGRRAAHAVCRPVRDVRPLLRLRRAGHRAARRWPTAPSATATLLPPRSRTSWSGRTGTARRAGGSTPGSGWRRCSTRTTEAVRSAGAGPGRGAPAGHGAGSGRGHRRARVARSAPGPDGRGPPARPQDRRDRGQRRRRGLRAGADPRSVRRDPRRLRRAGALDVQEGAATRSRSSRATGVGRSHARS